MSMTSLNGDFDNRLRRALYAEVDTVEPAADGLERILRRTSEPWLLRQLSLMLTECADLFWIIAIRLEPGASKLRRVIAARTGLLAAPAGRRHASPGRRARPRSLLSWLRPVLAVSAAVIVVVAGVYGLAQLRQSLVLDLFPNAGTQASTSPGTTNGGQPGGSVQGHTSPGGLLPAGGGPASATPSGGATCTRVAKKKHSPAPSSSPSPSPTATPTGTPTPTPAPTTTATSTAATTAFIATTSDAGLAGHCQRATSSKSAGTS
jgi:hypothetical protein